MVILYAEDSEDDVVMMHRAFAKAEFTGTLMVLPHGLAVLDYLAGIGAYSNREKYPLPQLILLDVKMPCLGGLEVLKWVRRNELFRDTPVLMLTSCRQATDIAAGYEAKADCYLIKPVDPDAFQILVKDLATLCGCGEGPLNFKALRGAVPVPPVSH
jgi:CheY-like chemotaxis protein